jgi:hypothetical protein
LKRFAAARFVLIFGIYLSPLQLVLKYIHGWALIKFKSSNIDGASIRQNPAHATSKIKNYEQLAR